jgi:hypothetical protein
MADLCKNNRMNPRHHNFHIPVMGIGYTVDTPAKVAHLGIDSVISLVDDGLIEKMRSHHCKISNRPYIPIPVKTDDYRAKRITAYLNTLKAVAEEKFNQLFEQRYEEGTELYKYVQLVPENSKIKILLRAYEQMNVKDLSIIENGIKKLLAMGSIDVNIMSKGDAVRYKNTHEKLPVEYNDAHAAVRGFMKSDLQNSSLIISAGLNPKLFTYISTFSEILPNADGNYSKKIVIKVSDYRSALVQGKFLAQRGVWVSEFRVESGLNCGGHAFATKGFLLGPILKEFADKREELIAELRQIYSKAMTDKGVQLIQDPPEILVSAQGGVGTSDEAEFLQKNYDISSVGWGSLFLLSPDVVNVDNDTLDLLKGANEDSIYLSDTSPFGIPFYSVKGNTKDREKDFRIKHNVPGSICPKRFVALNNEFGDKALCTASKDYQNLKIEKIKSEESNGEIQKILIDKVTARTCICVGLGTSALIVNGLERRIEGDTVSVCPGPNLAYYSEKANLIKTIDHIYGRANLITDASRPHMFIKEIRLYIDYMKTNLMPSNSDDKQKLYLTEFVKNLLDGIGYYQKLFIESVSHTMKHREQLLSELDGMRKTLLATGSAVDQSMTA